MWLLSSYLNICLYWSKNHITIWFNFLFKWRLQVGITPEGVEVPRSLVDEEMQEKLRAMPKEHQPYIPKGPDPKWRYMWRVGPRPFNTRFQVSYLSLLLQKCSEGLFCFHYLLLSSLAGTEFGTCHTWRFPWMERDHGFLGIQNDISNRSELIVWFSCLYMIHFI